MLLPSRNKVASVGNMSVGVALTGDAGLTDTVSKISCKYSQGRDLIILERRLGYQKKAEFLEVNKDQRL